MWRPLGGPEPLLKAEYDWNTEGLPDGTYVVRVVTSDERAQPRERALESTFVSPPLLVDNRKPEVLGLAAHYPIVSGRARDAASTITQIEMRRRRRRVAPGRARRRHLRRPRRDLQRSAAGAVARAARRHRARLGQRRQRRRGVDH